MFAYLARYATSHTLRFETMAPRRRKAVGKDESFGGTEVLTIA